MAAASPMPDRAPAIQQCCESLSFPAPPPASAAAKLSPAVSPASIYPFLAGRSEARYDRQPQRSPKRVSPTPALSLPRNPFPPLCHSQRFQRCLLSLAQSSPPLPKSSPPREDSKSGSPAILQPLQPPRHFLSAPKSRSCHPAWPAEQSAAPPSPAALRPSAPTHPPSRNCPTDPYRFARLLPTSQSQSAHRNLDPLS